MEFAQFFKDFLEAITPALQTLIVALVTALLGQASAWMVKQYQLKKAELSYNEQYYLDFFAARAVKTVEQLYFDEESQEKKNSAISIVERALSKYGLNIDVDVIADAIEAAVFKQNLDSLDQ